MLSKSNLQSLLECKRWLWLEHHRPDLIPRDDPVLYRRAVDGQIVGDKAREQLGPDFIWPLAHGDKAAAAEQAKAMLAASAGKPAAEFPMAHGGLYARADALLPEGERYVLRETKASTFPLKKDNVTPADPKDHHLNDVAIQASVMEASGLPLGRIELNLLNNQWRYPGGGDYGGLFRQLDVTREAHARKANVPGWMADAQAVLAGGMPGTQTGRHCTEPYPCPFRPYCETLDPPGPEHPIELLPDSAGNRMRGSFSIKNVVPVIAPELRYDELEEVQEGAAAQVAYLYATLDPNTTPERKAVLEAKLRVYCRQDTWAMVEIAYFLSRSGRPQRPDGM